MALLHFRKHQNKTGYGKISDHDHKSVKRQTHHRLVSYQNDGGKTENKILPPSPDLKDVEYFRNRAEEARALAEAMEDAHTKSLMLGIADSYEEIAKSYEKVANWERRLRDPNN